MRLPSALLALATVASAQWGRDADPGMARQMLRSVEDDLAAVLKDASRVEACVARHGLARIEALKRFRNPGLRPLFQALLDHDDWRVRHRALLVLERIGGKDALDAAWKLLAHPERRLREKAAITCVLLWDGREAAPPGAERDFFVRKALDALRRRARGELTPDRVHEEHVKTLPSGLALVPFVEAVDAPRPEARTGEGRPRPATRWTAPTLEQTDGAGVYACAEGVVTLVESGGAHGVRIVLEHRLEDRDAVRTEYRHLGGMVFVRAGDRVEGGQLLGTIGLGYSRENGGGPARLGFAIPGHDAERFLAHWIERTKPLVPDLRPVRLERVARDIGRGRWGRAYVAARKARDRATPGGETHVDAVYLMGVLSNAAARGLERARWLRDEGYPRAALERLDDLAVQGRGVPGIEKIEETLDAWKDDPTFKRALEGERRLDRARRQTDPDRARALLEKLRADYGDTCLKPRIDGLLR